MAQKEFLCETGQDRIFAECVDTPKSSSINKNRNTEILKNFAINEPVEVKFLDEVPLPDVTRYSGRACPSIESIFPHGSYGNCRGGLRAGLASSGA